MSNAMFFVIGIAILQEDVHDDQEVGEKLAMNVAYKHLHFLKKSGC